MLFDLFSGCLVIHNAEKSHGAVSPFRVESQQVSQQQHQLAVFLAAPPDVDRARRNFPRVIPSGLFVQVISPGQMFQSDDNDAAVKLRNQPQIGSKDFRLRNIVRPAKHHRIRPQTSNTVTLNQRLDPLRHKRSHNHRRKGFEFLFLDERSQKFLGTGTLSQPILDLSADDLRKRQDSVPRRKPVTVHRQMRPRPRAAAEGKDDRTPVFGMVNFSFEFQQVAPGSFELQATLHVAPASFDLAKTDVPAEAGHQDQRDDGPDPVDQKHDRQTRDRSQQRGRPVAETEPRSVTGILRDRLVERRQIQRSVSNHEKHRDDRSDGVQVAQQDARL